MVEQQKYLNNIKQWLGITKVSFLMHFGEQRRVSPSLLHNFSRTHCLVQHSFGDRKRAWLKQFLWYFTCKTGTIHHFPHIPTTLFHFSQCVNCNSNVRRDRRSYIAIKTCHIICFSPLIMINYRSAEISVFSFRVTANFPFV